jgi:transcriptional regulator with XRE-family HTH domain
MNVGRLIIEYRMRLGLSQAEIARRAGTKQSRISELETLNGNVRFDTLDKVAMALGLEVTLRERPSPFAAIVVEQQRSAETTYRHVNGKPLFFATQTQQAAKDFADYT